MTKTAEKIKVMQAFDEWKVKGFEQPAIIERTARACNDWKDVNFEPTWNWEAFEYRIKPADPEPLECWGNLRNSKKPNYYTTCNGTTIVGLFVDAWLNPEDAKKGEHVYGGGTIIRKGIHMREVTPQDEQDRKDAARYRQAKINRAVAGFPIVSDSPGMWDKKFDDEIKGNQ